MKVVVICQDTIVQVPHIFSIVARLQFTVIIDRRRLLRMGINRFRCRSMTYAEHINRRTGHVGLGLYIMSVFATMPAWVMIQFQEV